MLSSAALHGVDSEAWDTDSQVATAIKQRAMQLLRLDEEGRHSRAHIEGLKLRRAVAGDPVGGLGFDGLGPSHKLADDGMPGTQFNWEIPRNGSDRFVTMQVSAETVLEFDSYFHRNA